MPTPSEMPRCLQSCSTSCHSGAAALALSTLLQSTAWDLREPTPTEEELGLHCPVQPNSTLGRQERLMAGGDEPPEDC